MSVNEWSVTTRSGHGFDSRRLHFCELYYAYIEYFFIWGLLAELYILGMFILMRYMALALMVDTPAIAHLSPV